MTAAELYANTTPHLKPGAQVWDLPKSAHIIATVFAIVGGVAGTIGWPVGVGLGITGGLALGYGAYWTVEIIACRGCAIRGDIEDGIWTRYLADRSDLRSLSFDELCRLRRSFM